MMFKNVAFISYNHKDVRWAKWLRQRLEWYRLPSSIHNDISNTRYVRPVFRDRDDLDTGLLDVQLRSCLESSKFLIVICSRNSHDSLWVNAEVKFFIDHGWADRIIPFVIEGEGSEYFPTVLTEDKFCSEYGQVLGVPLYDEGKKKEKKALVRIVSRLFGVSFDSLWKRYKRRVRKMAACISAMTLLLSLSFCFYAIPVHLVVEIEKETCNLPDACEGRICINGDVYRIGKDDTSVVLAKFPGYYRFRKLPYEVTMNNYFMPIQSEVKVSWQPNQRLRVYLSRDDAYSRFAGKIVDASGNPLDGVTVTISDKSVQTDINGRFDLNFALSDQSVTKDVTISKGGYIPLFYEDEVPGKDIIYVLERL